MSKLDYINIIVMPCCYKTSKYWELALSQEVELMPGSIRQAARQEVDMAIETVFSRSAL